MLLANIQPALQVAAFGVAYFATLYVCAGLLGMGVRAALLRSGRGRLLDGRALAPGQFQREWRQSAVSVLIFGVGLVLPWAMMENGWARVSTSTSMLRTVAELVALLIWNELHFYAIHRVLHHPWLLRRVHAHHHASVVTTPWSTYAFHPLEAVLLGSVLLLPMMVWDFTWAALLLLPVLSLTHNAIGHSNCQALPVGWRWLSNARDHHLHHACHRGNYGFMMTFMDRALGTALADNAADAVMAAGRAREARAKVNHRQEESR